jgi:hypothetical protein
MSNSPGRLDTSIRCGCDAEALLRRELDDLREKLFIGLSTLFNEVLDKRIEEKLEALRHSQQAANLK